MAIAKPSLIERMMLINSVGVPKGRHSLERFARIGLAKAAIGNLLGSNSYGKKLIARYLRKAYAGEAQDVGELAALYHGMLSEGGVETYLKTLAAFDEQRIFGLFGEAKHRTLLIWGRHDKVLPPKNARILEEKLEDAKIVYMDESGHLPHEEEPEVMNRLIRQFVNTSSQIYS
jgi:pimeloyl-ACP methyl ester carboxylesterase